MKAIQSQKEVKIMKKILFMTLLLLYVFILISCTQNTTEKLITIDYYEITKTVTIGQIPLEENDLIAMVDLGGTHSIALSSSGRVFSWGYNNKGQLGDGTTIRTLTPVEITQQFSLEQDDKIISVALGDMHSAALSSKGRLFTWGWNFYGRLGDGTTTNRFVPTEITSLFNLNSDEVITKVALGVSCSAAITSEGRLFTWGENASGQLGDGTISNKSTPVDITEKFELEGDEKIIDASIGYVHMGALTSKGRLSAWGNNAYGQLGNGTNNLQVNPIEITSFMDLNTAETPVSIHLGAYHTMVVTSDDRVFTWGNNTKGQLGNETLTNMTSPVDITDKLMLGTNEHIVLSSSGDSYSILVTSVGRVFSWGENTNGQLGDGLNVNLSSPKDITSQFNLESNEAFRLLSTGESHSTLLTTYGKIIIWGDNENGKLGDNTTTDTLTPLEITLISNSQTLLKSESISLNTTYVLYDPEKEGFEFDGWYIDAGLEDPFSSTAMSPSANLLLYGEWVIQD